MKRYAISLSLIAAGLIFLMGMWWQENRHFRACEVAGGVRDSRNNLICVFDVGRGEAGDLQIFDEGDAMFDEGEIVNDSPLGTTKTVRGEVLSLFDDRSFDGNAGVVMKLGGGQIKISTIPSGFGGLPVVGEVDVVQVGDEIEVYGNYYKAPPFPDTFDSMDVFDAEYYLKKL